MLVVICLPTLQGELLRVPVLLRNVGGQALGGLSLIPSHPWVAPAIPPTAPSHPGTSPAKPPISFLQLLSGPVPGREVIPLPTSEGRRSTAPAFPLSPDSRPLLAPGETLPADHAVVLWIHAAQPGPLTFHCVWAYKPAGPTQPVAGMLIRTLRTSHTLSVAPLLRVAPSITPSVSQLYLLRMDVDVSKVGGLLGCEGGEAEEVSAKSCQAGMRVVRKRALHHHDGGVPI
jgi:hypothetical protein